MSRVLISSLLWALFPSSSEILDQLLQVNEFYKGAFLVWPRQVGKDTSCYAYLAKRAVEYVGNYFYIFPTKEMARKMAQT